MTGEGERPVRRTRQAAIPPVPRNPEAQRGGYLDNWGHVVTGIVSVDVEELYARVKAELEKRSHGRSTAAELDARLDGIANLYVDAITLAARARADYEVFKEDHAVWLEAKKTASRIALEEEKEEKGWKKQITVDMILDQVRVTWKAEYQKRVEALKNFQAAVHQIEGLADAVKLRARALDAQKDLLLATSPRG